MLQSLEWDSTSRSRGLYPASYQQRSRSAVSHFTPRLGCSSQQRLQCCVLNQPLISAHLCFLPKKEPTRARTRAQFNKLPWVQCYCKLRVLASFCCTTVNQTGLCKLTADQQLNLRHSLLYCFRFGLQESLKRKQRLTHTPVKWA